MTTSLKPEDIEPHAKLVEKEFFNWQQRFSSLFDPSREKLLATLNAQWEGPSLLQKAKSALAEIEVDRSRLLGKKSTLAALKKKIGLVDPVYRSVVGQRIRTIETSIEDPMLHAKDRLTQLVAELSLEHESIDVTIPGRRPRAGHLHPITLMRQRIEDIFVSLGYAVEDDREIETDFYNFDALNIPSRPAVSFAATPPIRRTIQCSFRSRASASIAASRWLT